MTGATDWPPGRPRVLVVDAWLANAGDGAIAVATDRLVREVAPGASVLHAAYQSDLVADHYPELTLVAPLAGLLGISRGTPELEGWPGGGRELVAGADAVLSQGGGYLFEHYDPWARLVAYDTVVALERPLAFCAQSIGPFRRSRNRAALRRALRAAVAVGVRDPESAGNALDLGAPPERVRVAADAAFALFPDRPPEVAGEGLAVVLSDYAADPGRGRPDDRRLAALLTAVVEAAGDEPVTLCSTVQGLGDVDRGIEDDGALGRRVAGLLPTELARRVRHGPEAYLGPSAFLAELRRHRAVATMRMHPAVFALSLGLPAVLLAPAAKTVATFAHVGLSSLPMAEDPVGAADAVRAVLDPGHPRGGPVWDGLEQARQLAASNRAVVEALLRPVGSRWSRAGTVLESGKLPG